ncbi:MAB_1171c family putative transporter [Actinocrispum wychmicini]|uniref:DUF6545 domain-containing protein n=1 Tax=Actinocrispum wychmicini TaxID=1213861 RepID=A0A4R2IWU7_9PSEU|nr:MAB_1171c family putative transporter [Actinocrispum wychmicini]TCO49757.1 hypothetical protein EV192_114127 [Actinocrispum wychmicini]
MSTAFFLLVTAGCVAALAYRLRELTRNPGDRSLRALCLLLAAIAVSVGVLPFVPALDRLIGIPQLGGFVSDCAVLVAAGAGQVFLIRVYQPPEQALSQARWRYRAMVATLVAIIVLFVLSPPDPHFFHGDPRTMTGHLPVLPSPYLYLYLHSLYLGGTLIAVIRMCLRYAGLTEQRFLRTGLRVLTAGCVVALVYVVTFAVTFTLPEFGVDVDSWAAATVRPMYLTADMLVITGSVIPSLGPKWQRVADNRALRRLRPLWHAVYQASPDIALFPPTTGGDVRLRLYRQVIEIRDAQLALRPYVDPRAARIAGTLGRYAGLSDRRVAAVVEAATLAAALAAKATGRPPSEHPEPPMTTPAALDGAVASEVAWLGQVARAFHTSPIVTRTLATLSGQDHQGRYRRPRPR